MSGSSALATLNDFVQNPAFHEYLAILKGARNGVVYGAKVRFPHALVMSILFGRGSWLDRAKFILNGTRTHATNLGKFVALYKTLLLLQKKTRPSGKSKDIDSFIAGLIGGYLVFGTRSAINEQIVLYVISRVIASFIPRNTAISLPATAGGPSTKILLPDPTWFGAVSGIAWGFVMWRFATRSETLQPGLYNSMTYLYWDSNYWSDLKTLLWHNK